MVHGMLDASPAELHQLLLNVRAAGDPERSGESSKSS